MLALGYLPENSESVDLLIEVFEDEYCGIGKYAIVQALSVINSTKAVEHLVSVANTDSDRMLRELAIQGLSGSFIDAMHEIFVSEEEVLQTRKLQQAGLLKLRAD